MHDVYRGKDCMKKFCESLGEQSYQQKNSRNHMKMQKSVIFTKQKLKINIWKIYRKVRLHCHYTGECRGAASSICNSKYSVPKKIPIIIHNRSNYDDHFIVKELAQKFKKQIICLGENTEKYITCAIPIENISYILSYI